MDISHLREEYEKNHMDDGSLLEDPFAQFQQWFAQAKSLNIPGGANAMSLATADQSGRPGLRTVLLKYFDREGFVFFTNHRSKKAQELTQNPQATLLFPWLLLERQVIISGTVERVSTQQSLKYFLTRPRNSQISAWCSHQSQRINNRALLHKKFMEIKEKFKTGSIPLPEFWGGYRVKPQRFEFWQGRSDRLHDRFEYLPILETSTWEMHRLEP